MWGKNSYFIEVIAKRRRKLMKYFWAGLLTAVCCHWLLSRFADTWWWKSCRLQVDLKWLGLHIPQNYLVNHETGRSNKDSKDRLKRLLDWLISRVAIVAQRYNSTTPSLTPSLNLLLTVATVAERGWLGAYVLEMVNA